MAYPSQSELKYAERLLRRDDRALRLRFSTQSDLILLERKTYRGRVGVVGDFTRDDGRRREEGHIEIASVGLGVFDAQVLRDTLRAADTWRRWDRNTNSRADRVEEAESRARNERRTKRQMDLGHHASNLFDRYVWKHKQRVSMR